MRLEVSFMLAVLSHVAWGSVAERATFGYGMIAPPPTSITHGVHLAMDFGSEQIALMILSSTKGESKPFSMQKQPYDWKGTSDDPISLLHLMKGDKAVNAKLISDKIKGIFGDQITALNASETNVLPIFGGGTEAVRVAFRKDPKELTTFITNINENLAEHHVRLHFSIMSQEDEGKYEALSGNTLIKIATQNQPGVDINNHIGTVGFGSKSIQITMFNEEGPTVTGLSIGRNTVKKRELSHEELEEITNLKCVDRKGMMLMAGAAVFVIKYTDAGVGLVGVVLDKAKIIEHLTKAEQDLLADADAKNDKSTINDKAVADKLIEKSKPEETLEERKARKKMEARLTKMLRNIIKTFHEEAQCFFQRLFECGDGKHIKTGWVTGHFIAMRQAFLAEDGITWVARDTPSGSDGWKWYIWLSIGAAAGIFVALILAALFCGGETPEYEDEIIENAADDNDDASVASNESKKNKKSKKHKKKGGDKPGNDVDEAAEQV